MAGETTRNGTFSVQTAQDTIREHERVLQLTLYPALRRWKQMYGGINRPETAALARAFGANIDKSVNADGEGYMDTNYAFMTVDTGRSSVVPGNPQVQIHSMSAEVDSNRTKTAESLVNYSFRQGKMRRLLNRMNGLTMLHGVAFMKAYYDTSVSRVRYRVIPRTDLFYDPLAETWDEVGYVIHKTVLHVEEVRQRLERGRYVLPAGMTVDQAIHSMSVRASNYAVGDTTQITSDSPLTSRLGRPTPRDILEEDNHVRSKQDVVVVYEVFDFLGDRYWHFGGPQMTPLFVSELPYELTKNPFRPLVYNDALEGIAGLSDMGLIEPLVQQIHFMDATRMRHAQACIPRTLVNDDALEDPDGFQDDLLSANGPGHLVRVKLANSSRYTNLGEIFHTTPQPSLLPEFASTIQRVEDKIEQILGVSPFQRGVVGAGRVATEFALADQANKSRTAERMQALGDLLEGMAVTTLDLYNQLLPKTEQVYMRVAGTSTMQVANRETLPFFKGISAVGTMLITVVPVSPQEATRDSRLARLMELVPVLTQLDPEGVNVDAVTAAIVDAAALSPDLIFSQEEKVERGKVAAEITAQMEAEAAAQGVALPPAQIGAPPVAAAAPPSRRGAMKPPHGQDSAPPAQGAMVGGAGR